MKKLLLFLLLSVAAFAQQTDPGYAYYRNTALSSTDVAIKTSTSNLFGYTLINVNTVPVYVKFYNGTVANVVVGTTVPQAVIMVPPGNSAAPGVVYLCAAGTPTEFFSMALTVAAVTGLADNSTAAPSTAIYMEALYK